jgi:hypothetical protein
VVVGAGVVVVEDAGGAVVVVGGDAVVDPHAAAPRANIAHSKNSCIAVRRLFLENGPELAVVVELRIKLAFAWDRCSRVKDAAARPSRQFAIGVDPPRGPTVDARVRRWIRLANEP